MGMLLLLWVFYHRPKWTIGNQISYIPCKGYYNSSCRGTRMAVLNSMAIYPIFVTQNDKGGIHGDARGKVISIHHLGTMNISTKFLSIHPKFLRYFKLDQIGVIINWQTDIAQEYSSPALSWLCRCDLSRYLTVAWQHKETAPPLSLDSDSNVS